jgi:hypothetical protein
VHEILPHLSRRRTSSGDDGVLEDPVFDERSGTSECWVETTSACSSVALNLDAGRCEPSEIDELLDVAGNVSVFVTVKAPLMACVKTVRK